MKNFIKTAAMVTLGVTITQCSGLTSGTDIKTLYISSEQKDCSAGVRKMKCMLVKENKTGDYEYFYNNIEGFSYQPGYEYELKVRVEKINNPPADASSLKYILVEEVLKTKKQNY